MSRVFISVETFGENSKVENQYFVIPLNFLNNNQKEAHFIANSMCDDIENMFKKINHKTIIVIHEDSIDNIFVKEDLENLKKIETPSV
jgi:pyruvate dehydrogenase complex dehydrogenase (E1) component